MNPWNFWNHLMPTVSFWGISLNKMNEMFWVSYPAVGLNCTICPSKISSWSGMINTWIKKAARGDTPWVTLSRVSWGRSQKPLKAQRTKASSFHMWKTSEKKQHILYYLIMDFLPNFYKNCLWVGRPPLFKPPKTASLAKCLPGRATAKVKSTDDLTRPNGLHMAWLDFRWFIGYPNISCTKIKTLLTVLFCDSPKKSGLLLAPFLMLLRWVHGVSVFVSYWKLSPGPVSWSGRSSSLCTCVKSPSITSEAPEKTPM